MSLRHQLPVSSPISAQALAAALRPAVAREAGAADALSGELRAAFDARTVALTDSGTSALVLALRLAAGEGGEVAFPAYGCVDLAAAAVRAGVRVRLYDLDPATLGVDLDSLSRALARGPVRAVVVVHLYGYPADIDAVGALAAARGATVIEDAAQGAWGSLRGRRLGAFGPLSVLSFGRGKGLTGGGGGALLSGDAEWDDALSRAAASLGRTPGGIGNLASAAAQWALGRPALYGIPLAIPALRLGEMVYHPAHEPRSISAASAALVHAALAGAERELATRRRHAALFATAVAESESVRDVRPIEGAAPGFLRFPVLDAGIRAPDVRIGVLRGYPRTLFEQEELRPSLAPGEVESPGALELRRALFTLPTHGKLSPRDVRDVRRWLRVGGLPSAATVPSVTVAR